jgi:capsid portal protein
LRQDLHDWLEDCNEEETFKETLIKVYTDVEATGNGYLEIGRTSAGKIWIYRTYSIKDNACSSPA